jgi:hypothetical protein
MTRKTLQTFQCPHTRDCGNDQCFWRQRDAFGYQAVTSAFMTTQQLEMVQAKRDAIKDAYGDPYVPTWEEAMAARRILDGGGV